MSKSCQSQVLQKLYENLFNDKLGLSDIRQAEAGQKRKLAEILKAVNRKLEYDLTGTYIYIYIKSYAI